ncbi:MAG: hypothetical protein HC803_05485 [Saprospiraceae bacterium]|nr:hypothetical protein [Saprospiraceae bacterium]
MTIFWRVTQTVVFCIGLLVAPAPKSCLIKGLSSFLASLVRLPNPRKKDIFRWFRPYYLEILIQICFVFEVSFLHASSISNDA